MNRVYIISYDLKLKWLRGNYSNLYNTLESFPSWMHYMENTWFVESNLTPTQIYKLLAPSLFNDCQLIITPMTSDYFGLLQPDAWTWIKERSHLLI